MREQRERMTETFAAVRDALDRALVRSLSVVVDGKLQSLPRPWYLPEVPAQTPAQYRAAIAKLARLAPRNVKVN